jgi:hypothetical protein
MRRREFCRKPVLREAVEEEGLSPHSRKIAKLMEGASEEKEATGDSEIKAEVSIQRAAGSFEVIALDE